jgi:hypothetical protein
VAAGICLVAQVASPLTAGASRGQPADAFPIAPPPRPAPPLPPASMDKVSSRRRLPALVLTMVFFATGMGGLQRFYVGKVATGLLWLFTFGLFGVGQLVDLIMIITGRFRDRRGRPLVVWEGLHELRGRLGSDGLLLRPPAEEKTRSDPSPSSVTAYQPVSALFSALGGVVLLAAILLGLAATVLPTMAAAGVLGRELPAMLSREIGMRDWPGMLTQIGIIAAVVLTVLAAILLIVARRTAGLPHMLRGIAGSAGTLAAMCILGSSVHGVQWDRVGEGPPGQAVNMFLGGAESGPAILAAFVLLASVMVLVWPPRRLTAQQDARAPKESRQ